MSTLNKAGMAAGRAAALPGDWFSLNHCTSSAWQLERIVLAHPFTEPWRGGGVVMWPERWYFNVFEVDPARRVVRRHEGVDGRKMMDRPEILADGTLLIPEHWPSMIHPPWPRSTLTPIPVPCGRSSACHADQLELFA